MSDPRDDTTPEVLEYAARTVDYVRGAVGVDLAYDSDTLPLLDHYLREVPEDRPETIALVVATAGCYFGEVVRRRLGGHWAVPEGAEAHTWRITLPTGISFCPAGLVGAAIAHSDDLADLDATFEVPPRLEPYVESALARMGDVTEETYYSLCGRFDTLEHLQSVLLAIAEKLARERGLTPDD